MSRCYEVRLEVRGLSLAQVRREMTQSGWDEDYGEEAADEHHRPQVEWSGSGALGGTETEAQAHQRLIRAFRRLNPACQVRTRWLCTELCWENANEFGSLEDDL